MEELPEIPEIPENYTKFITPFFTELVDLENITFVDEEF